MSADHQQLIQTRQCLCLASRRAARAITQQFDRALRAHGIRATQFTLLAVLELKGPQSIGALADLLGADRTTVTRNLAVAEQQSLVGVSPGEDARARIASITTEGRRILRRAFTTWRAVQESLTRAMGRETADSLRRISGEPASRVRRARPMASRLKQA
jgi:DNA-binding MarR family transcriptional regulator